MRIKTVWNWNAHRTKLPSNIWKECDNAHNKRRSGSRSPIRAIGFWLHQYINAINKNVFVVRIKQVWARNYQVFLVQGRFWKWRFWPIKKPHLLNAAWKIFSILILLRHDHDSCAHHRTPFLFLCKTTYRHCYRLSSRLYL